METSLRFIVADNKPQGILSHQSQLEKDFSAKITFTHNIDTLGEEVGKKESSILFYDLDFIDKRHAINILSEIRFQVPDLTILPIVSKGNTELIRQLVGLQLFFYIITPLEYKDLKITVRRALEAETLTSKKAPKRRAQPQEKEQKTDTFHGIIGKSSSMSSLYNVISKVGVDDYSTVLIHGESGTGKEMVAKAIHQSSPRSKYNFVPVNCAAIPDELLESELFGYTKGAFTGATTNKPGRIQYADKGTLFLDEIGDMKPSLQAKLLRVLQEREFEPVGGFKATAVDTRVLAATHCNLEQLVKEGLFREDLYYRLSVVPIEIPPLRDRKEDIPLLIKHFIAAYTIKRARPSFSFSPDATRALLEHEWRGNVRELENLIQHMSVLHSGSIVQEQDLPVKFTQKTAPTSTESSFSERQALWDNPIPLSQNIPSELHISSMEKGELSFNPEQAEPIKDLPPVAAVQEDFEALSRQFSEQVVQEEEKIEETIEVPTIHWEEDGVDFKDLVCSFENQLIIKALQQTSGNKKEAAQLLGLKRTTLLEKIKKKGLQNAWLESPSG